jgi:hypothetical protein
MREDLVASICKTAIVGATVMALSLCFMGDQYVHLAATLWGITVGVVMLIIFMAMLG